MQIIIVAESADKNNEYSPCSDTKVERGDGFSFGIAFSTKESFFFNETQLSPCDKRLPLSGSIAQLAVFRPKVDEISLLSIDDTNNFDPVCTSTLYHCFFCVCFFISFYIIITLLGMKFDHFRVHLVGIW